MERFALAGVQTTPLETVVVCDCGHPVGVHDSLGCRGSRPRYCGCERNSGDVLDVAIDRSVADHRANLR